MSDLGYLSDEQRLTVGKLGMLLRAGVPIAPETVAAVMAPVREHDVREIEAAGGQAAWWAQKQQQAREAKRRAFRGAVAEVVQEEVIQEAQTPGPPPAVGMSTRVDMRPAIGRGSSAPAVGKRPGEKAKRGLPYGRTRVHREHRQ